MRREASASGVPFEIVTEEGEGARSFDSADLVTGSEGGVSSTVECFPRVHGGIARNSSKVRTRGLQQFQPSEVSQYMHNGNEIRKGVRTPFCPS